MKVEMWPADRPTPYAENPRKNDGAVESVADSIQRFGWRQPIVVDERGVIIVGHTRHRAAVLLGLKEVPVHVADGLTPTQVRAYRLADNRTHEDSSWDDDLLVQELMALEAEGAAHTSGFREHELHRMLETETGGGESFDGSLPESPKSKPGSVYKLGPHRLICGDATDPPVLQKLCGDARPVLLWTDPPYGVNYTGKTKRALTIQNDASEDTFALLCDAFEAAAAVLAERARFYIAAPGGPQGTLFRLAIDRVGWQFHQELVWVKDVMVLGHSDYHYQHEKLYAGEANPEAGGEDVLAEAVAAGRSHEDVLYGFLPGGGRPGRGRHGGSRWNGPNNATTVLEFPKPKRNAEHPTMKPTELIAHCLLNSSIEGDPVLDLFGGSGSTLIACEEMGRVAYLSELDPAYCDVIRRRYASYVGNARFAP